ncbi:MAG: hypothetical protein H7329_04375 [Opitutaceae bacterium]|nr:hypothetical protein [Cytophagales bacterium]
MPTNNISATFAQADLELILKDLSEIESKLPFLVSQTNKDKRSKQLMGTNSIGYVQYGLSTAKNNEDVLARNFSIEEYEKDVLLVNQLQQLHGRIAPLAQKIKDTLSTVGQELMIQTNEVYSVVKREAKTNGKLKQVADELGKRYEVSSQDNTPVTPLPGENLN